MSLFNISSQAVLANWDKSGYIHIKHVDPRSLENPNSDCVLEMHEKDEASDNNDPAIICGISGILAESVVPIGTRLL